MRRLEPLSVIQTSLKNSLGTLFRGKKFFTKLLWILPLFLVVQFSYPFFRQSFSEKNSFHQNSQAQRLFEEGKWEMAAMAFEKEIVLSPQKAQLHLQLAILYDDYLGKKEQGIVHYETYLKLAPEDEKAPLVRQWLQEIKQEDKTLISHPPPLGEKLEEVQNKEGTHLLDLERENQSLKSQITEQTIQIQKLQQLIHEKEKTMTSLKTQSESLSSEKSMQETSKELQDAKTKITQLEMNKRSLEIQIQDSEEAKNTAKKQINELKALQERKPPTDLRERNLQTFRVENAELKKEMETYEENEATLLTQINTLKVYQEKLKNKILEYQKLILSKSPKKEIREGTTLTPLHIKPMKRYKVCRGESLRSIAERMYGDKDKWRIIYNANRSRIVNPNILTSGQVLDIPEIQK
ncbi:MAG: LysM peptidoglycan-binding domain-containing protein [Chlamydiae bacterium]|nr:LysM peptidoglycan-binding domain-containing protein [Chlamydiota bacterium]MBI3267202.1 LysM peptidoglycan-binding domain-containing protein [Chlamydiota bacterium]